MTDDQRELEAINLAIGDAENRGDAEALAAMLAPRLAFQRADAARTVDDQVAFLQKVAAGGTRVTRLLEPIELHGNRAIVKCMVTTADGKEFHNIRLFVRRDGQWRLLGWANEPA